MTISLPSSLFKLLYVSCNKDEQFRLCLLFVSLSTIAEPLNERIELRVVLGVSAGARARDVVEDEQTRHFTAVQG